MIFLEFTHLKKSIMYIIMKEIIILKIIPELEASTLRSRWLIYGQVMIITQVIINFFFKKKKRKKEKNRKEEKIMLYQILHGSFIMSTPSSRVRNPLPR